MTIETTDTERLHKLDLDILGIGVKTRHLRARGIMSIGDIIEYGGPERLVEIDHIGFKTMNGVKNGIEHLRMSAIPVEDPDIADPVDGIDWNRYGELNDMPVVPYKRYDPSETSYGEMVVEFSPRL